MDYPNNTYENIKRVILPPNFNVTPQFLQCKFLFLNKHYHFHFSVEKERVAGWVFGIPQAGA
jgi:hypothetical protein